MDNFPIYINDDIKKIEQALEICLDDVEAETAQNAVQLTSLKIPSTILSDKFHSLSQQSICSTGEYQTLDNDNPVIDYYCPPVPSTNNHNVQEESSECSQIFDSIPDIQQYKLSDCRQFIDNYITQAHTVKTNLRQKHLITLVAALNLCYQRSLFELSSHIQILEKAEEMVILNAETEELNTLPVSIFEQYIDYPLYKMESTTENPVQNMLKLLQKHEKGRLWTSEPLNKLSAAAYKSAYDNKIFDLTRKIQIAQSVTRDNKINQQHLKLYEKDLKDVRTLSSKQLFRLYNLSIDWYDVATNALKNQFSEKCCQKTWEQICHPSLNQGPWSVEEDDKLYRLVQKYGCYGDQWQLIAKNMPGRSSYLCAKRFMYLENIKLDNTNFSNSEKETLCQIVEDKRSAYYIPFNRISYLISNRTPRAIRKQWDLLDPYRRVGQWQVEEDEMLMNGVQKQSRRSKINWNLIAENLPGRLPRKCYHRYLHLINRITKTSIPPFAPSEDVLLLEKYEDLNAKWSDIQKFFPGRTCYNLQNRYRKLMSYKQLNELFYAQS
ncbi:unnamed protein product, partial [Didymodactylos carnosus]